MGDLRGADDLPTLADADVSEFHLRIIMQRSASPFVIRDAVRYVAERWYPPSAWAPPNRAALSAHEDASARMPNSWRSHTRQRKLLYHWASSRTRIGEITLGEGVVPVPDASDIGMLGHVPPPRGGCQRTKAMSLDYRFLYL